MARIQLDEVSSKPAAPPAGAIEIYAKTDDVVYVQNSAGTEVPIGTPSAITDLHGDVTATGPGDVSATVNSVGGSSAANIHSAELAANAATSTNTPNTIVKRDGSGNFSAGTITAALTGAASANVLKTGDTMSGVLAMGGNKITSVADPTLAQDAATKNYVDTTTTSNPIYIKKDGTVAFTGDESMGGHKLTNVTDPTSAQDASTKNYTDTKVAKAGDTMTGPLVISVSSTGALVVGSNVLQVDTVNGRIGINQPSPTQALDVIGNGLFSGTVTASNISGGNTGDVTVLDTNSIDLTLIGQQISADLKLSADAADASNLKATTTIHADGLHIEYLFGTPVQIGTSNFVGAASGFALYDHVHAHGNQTSPTLHAIATSIANGFMSSTDKAKTDTELPASLGTANQVLGVNNAGTAGEYKSVLGTTNQIVVTHGVGSITLSTPQDIATSSSPTFANITDSGLTLGSVVFAGTGGLLSQNNSNFFWDNSNLALGIGTIPAATAVLDIVNNSGSTKAIQVTGYGSNVGFRGREALGTLSSPTALTTGSNITFFSGRGYGATGFAAASTGAVNIVAAENFTDSTMATYIAINTTPTGSVTSSERMRISQTGNILIGTTIDNGKNKLQVNGSLITGIVALVDAANIATDASLGNLFTVTLGGNRNLSAPTNPIDGQKIIYKITQDGTGNRGLTFDAIFDFGLDIVSFTPSTGAGKTDYIGCIYSSSATKWNVVATSKGF